MRMHNDDIVIAADSDILHFIYILYTYTCWLNP